MCAIIKGGKAQNEPFFCRTASFFGKEEYAWES